MNNDWQIWVAVYAAIVATGALFLEVRRWFESGPRLFVTASPNMTFLSSGSDRSDHYVIISVSNRGSLSTTITHLCLFQYDNWWQKVCHKPIKSEVVLDPSLGLTSSGQIPCILEPGKEWKGLIPQDNELNERIDTGKLYAGIFATHQDRPVTTGLRIRAESP